MKPELLSLCEFINKLPNAPIISLSGAGGKTTLMYRMADMIRNTCMLTTTTKVGADQIQNAELRFSFSELPSVVSAKTMWVSPSLDAVNGKIHGFDLCYFHKLSVYCKSHNFVLINEADGAARKHIKAPGSHEPVIPEETEVCIYLAGLDVIGLSADNEHVHRPDFFSKITGAVSSDRINAEHIVKLFDHSEGGIKNMPVNSFHVAYLTHVDTDERIQSAIFIAEHLRNYDFILFSK